MAGTDGQMIRDGLRKLGLQPGDSALVHSSLKSFGHVDGGADAVIDALIEAVSPGTILFPTLTGHKDLSPANPPHFDVASTPCWTGKIPETARNRPGFVRSAHPTHSVCAFGGRAEWFVEGHEHSPTPCGIGSPYDKLAQAEGFILLLGVNHDANTTMHYVEEIAGVPWHLQDEKVLARIKYRDGRVIEIPTALHKYGSKPRDFNRLEPEFIARGIQVNGKIGDCIVRLIKAREMVDLALERVREDPTILLPLGERGRLDT